MNKVKLLTKKFLIEEYKIKNISLISKETKISASTIWDHIHRYKIKTGHHIHHNTKNLNKQFLQKHYINNKESATEIGKQLGCAASTVLLKLRKYNFPVRHFFEQMRKYSALNLNYIEKMSTPEIAYFIGFVTADGCVYTDNKSIEKLAIQLSDKDTQLLYEFNRVLDVNIPIKHNLFKKKVTFELHQKGLVQVFNYWKITPRKSLTIVFPTNIPKKMFGHYLRGLFDGDGCITFIKNKSKISSCTVKFCGGSKQYLVGLQKALQVYKIISDLHRSNIQETCWTLRIRSSDFTKIKDLMYNSDTISLKRKKEKFNFWIKHLKSLKSKDKLKSRVPGAKLTWKQLAQIKILRKRKYSYKEIGLQYKVSPTCIYDFLSGKTYVRTN